MYLAVVFMDWGMILQREISLQFGHTVNVLSCCHTFTNCNAENAGENAIPSQ